MFKKISALAALTLLAATVPTTAITQVAPWPPGTYTWYSDETYTQQVGYRIIECNGVLRGPYGYRTPHVIFEPLNC